MKALRRILPDVIDLHVYGGAALLAFGLGMWATWAGPAVFGAVLMALGLRRP